jgi:hypothetical protein
LNQDDYSSTQPTRALVISPIRNKTTRPIPTSTRNRKSEIIFNTNSDDDDDIYLQSNNEEEYTLYLKDNISSKEEEPLAYWKNNSHRFPILSILARQYLAIPATSAAIERVFSISSNIITKSRNRLDPKIVQELTLLKS